MHLLEFFAIVFAMADIVWMVKIDIFLPAQGLVVSWGILRQKLTRAMWAVYTLCMTYG